MDLDFPHKPSQRAPTLLVLLLTCDREAVRADVEEAYGEVFADGDVMMEIRDRARAFVREIVKGTAFTNIEIVDVSDGDVVVEAKSNTTDSTLTASDRALIFSRRSLVLWNFSLTYLAEEIV